MMEIYIFNIYKKLQKGFTTNNNYYIINHVVINYTDLVS